MTNQPQDSERSAGGGDSRNLATRRRQAHREEVLEKLRSAGLVQQVLDDAKKLADESLDIDAAKASRIKAANDLRLKLINKFLPDVKSVEMTGEDGGPIEAVTRIRLVAMPAKDE